MNDLTGTQTYNVDCLNFVNKVDRAIVEANFCETANVSELGDEDFQNIKDFHQDLVVFLGIISTKPKVASGESHGKRVYNAGAAPESLRRENDSVNYICTLLLELRDGVLNCESSRLGTSIQEKCKSKANTVLDKIKQFFGDYIENKDRPVLSFTESSPSQPSVGAGHRGVDSRVVGA